MTFQIGLHIDDLEVLKFIQKNLGCGKISISGNRCNFFVNDRASLINIIIPVFNFIELKSSKYNQFLVFEKAVNLIKNKDHLTAIGRLEIIKLYHESKNPPICLRSNIEINKYWLGGFIVECFYKPGRPVIIATNSFTQEDVNLLAKTLTNKFDLDCSIHKNNRGSTIRISTKSLPVLQTLLAQHMPSIVRYKIGM